MATAYASLPASWSNKNEVERLRRDAYESLTRMLNRAVAETGTNFSIWSALRTHAEQVALFKENYTRVSRGRKYSTDRAYAGSIWARKPGGVSVASPDLGSNHQDGLAVDIHPGAIQSWIQKNGLLYGWSWDEGRRVGEPWHVRYIPSRDQMKHEGLLDHAAVQRMVGAEVDGKIGTGTIKLIEAWQKAHGLTADGKVGPATKRKMGLSGKDDAAPVPSVPSGGTSVPTPPPAPALSDGFTYSFSREQWDTQPVADTVHAFNQDVLGTYLHYPASSGSLGGLSVDQLAARLRGYRADHQDRQGWKDIGYGAAVDQAGRSYELRGLGMEVGSNGAGNNGQYTSILFLIGNDEEPTAEAIAAANGLLAQIRAAHPKAELIAGHRDAPGVSTACPGAHLMRLIADGAFSYDGKPYVRPAPAPTNPTALPTGKALLMALINAPDFPLLRTSKHRCYYGPQSGPKESVSGHVTNSLNPGEVGDGAGGLKDWQAQMVERGYSLAVDGKYGDKTATAADNLQRLAGLTRDRLIGPDTFYAAWLLPVQ